ncbi:MAG: cobalamin-binding protein [Hyphomicrobiaceae bacterium]
MCDRTARTRAERCMRIVSLISSATEILSALGAQSQLVGRSHECDFPKTIRDLPQLTEPKFKVEGTSGEIDERVRAIVTEGLSVYRVDAEALRALRPDLIVTQDHCEVCAVSIKDVEAAVCGWTGGAARIVSLRPDSLPDVYADIVRVADALGNAKGGERLCAAMKTRFATISDAVQGRRRPRVAFIEWGEPLMSGGNWMPTLIRIAGGTSIFGVEGGRSEVLSWADLGAADPEVVLIAPCGFTLEQSIAELRQLERHPAWSTLKAVKDGRVYCADGNAYFNRPGPRLVESAEIVAEILHPETCRFGHEGAGWVRQPS